MLREAIEWRKSLEPIEKVRNSGYCFDLFVKRVLFVSVRGSSVIVDGCPAFCCDEEQGQVWKNYLLLCSKKAQR